MASVIQNILDLPTGSVARIVSYSHENAFTQRLSEMGLVPGTTFTFVRRAPLHGPIEISFGQSRIAMRPASSVEICVERIH